MIYKEINRRDFLKETGLLVLSAIALHFRQLTGLFSPLRKSKNTSLKEAKHYSVGKKLAG